MEPADDTGQAILDDTELPIVRAIGEELRLARMSAGWTRPDLVKRMNRRMPINTYACYEQGTRQCPISSLVEICQVLGVSAPELLGRALHSLGLDSGGGEYLSLLRGLRAFLVPQPAREESGE